MSIFLHTQLFKTPFRLILATKSSLQHIQKSSISKSGYRLDTSSISSHLVGKPSESTGFSIARRLKVSKKDSYVTSYLSLFVRRQRFLANRIGNNTEALKRTKFDKSGVKRLIGLAKPERYKLAGICSSFFIKFY